MCVLPVCCMLYIGLRNGKCTSYSTGWKHDTWCVVNCILNIAATWRFVFVLLCTCPDCPNTQSLIAPALKPASLVSILQHKQPTIMGGGRAGRVMQNADRKNEGTRTHTHTNNNIDSICIALGCSVVFVCAATEPTSSDPEIYRTSQHPPPALRGLLSRALFSPVLVPPTIPLTPPQFV